MSTLAQQNTPPSQQAARRKIGLLDWLMLVLALVSVGLLVWETAVNLAPDMVRLVLLADLVICGIFAVEFTWRWYREGWTRSYLKHNWYEILGMIPVQHPAVRGFRLFRIIRIIILLSRFGMAADRAFGDEFTYRLVNRFQRQLVNAIKTPVTVAMLEEVSRVLAKGHYTGSIAGALKENEASIEAMIAEKLRQDPQTGRLKHLPFYDEIVENVTQTSFRVIMEVLQDARTEELVADTLKQVLSQIGDAVAGRSERTVAPDTPRE